MNPSETSPNFEESTRTRLVNGRLVDAAVAGDYDPRLYQFDSVAATVDGFESITAEHLTHYVEQGYLVIERAFSVDRVRDACAALTRILDAEVDDPTSVQFESWAADQVAEMGPDEKLFAARKFMDFTKKDPRLAGIALDKQLLSLVGRLMNGAEPTLLQEMALLKPSGGREKPWHQDRAYFNVESGKPIVGTWIALDPATPENGCMRLCPGRHLGEPFVHFQRRDWQICDTQVEALPRVAVPLQPGGLLLFHSLLPHGTPCNATRKRRWALQFHYCPSNARRTDDAERMAIFGSEGKDVQC